MGGMAANIPVKNDPAANERALQKVREDKRREATDGHDGTWVAHPGLVPIAREEFDRVLGDKPNQIDRLRPEVNATAEQLIEVPTGSITEEGLRTNIRVGVQYLEAWLGGLGCVPLYHLMEDAATAEISRSQVWQWVHNPRGILDDGRKVTVALVRQFLQQELERIRREHGPARFGQGRFAQAAQLFDELVTSETLEEFLTLKAYDRLDEPQEDKRDGGEISAEAKTVPFRRLADESHEQLKKVA
jgi:malate synthase